jgi:hypothetical protein
MSTLTSLTSILENNPTPTVLQICNNNSQHKWSTFNKAAHLIHAEHPNIETVRVVDPFNSSSNMSTKNYPKIFLIAGGQMLQYEGKYTAAGIANSVNNKLVQI